MPDPNSDQPTTPITFERERGVYAINVIRDVAFAIIEIGDQTDRIAGILHVLRVLSKAYIPVFCVKMHRTAITLSCAGTNLQRAEAALNAANLQAETRRDLCLVAVNAAAMRDLHGVMSNISDALSAAQAKIYATSDSHNSVQCLIEAEKLAPAVQALCKTFQLPETAVRETSIETEGAE